MIEPRLLSREQAAAYCGITPTCFSMWVSSHKMPPAIPGTRKWDKKAIDAKLDEISGLVGSDNEDPYEKWMRENAGQTTIAATRDLKHWEESKKKRDKLRPLMGLDAKLQRVVLYMDAHPECGEIDLIPSAGPVHMNQLMDLGAVVKSGGVFYLTQEGRKEAQRIKNWNSQR